MGLDHILRRIAAFFGLLVCLMGVTAVLGWFIGTDLHGWLRAVPGPMKFNVGLCFAFAGASLMLQHRRPTQLASVICAGISALVAGVTDLEWLFAIQSTAFDELFAAYPGPGLTARMSGATATSLLMISVALMSMALKRRRWAPAIWLANLVIATSVAGLLGIGLRAVPAVARPFSLGPLIATGLLLLGIGVLFARPNEKPISTLFSRGAGGIFARRLFFGAAIVPLIFACAFVFLLQAGAVELPQGASLLTMALVFAGFGVALFTIETAGDIQESREEAEQARLLLTARLQEQAAQLQETVSARTQELQAANASLRAAAESNALLATVAKNSTNGVVITDANGRIEWANPAFTRVTGYELAEIRGRKPGHFLQGAETDADTVAQLRNAQIVGQPCNVEILNYTKQGAVFWQIVDMQPIRDGTGRIINFVANLTDITSQRADKLRMEALNERFRLALRSSNFGVWEYDFTTGRRVWDERVLEIYGLRPGEMGDGTDAWVRALHPDDRVAAENYVRRVIAGEVPEYNTAFRIVRPDGTVRHIESYGYLQHDERGRPLRLVGLNRDVTEQKQMAQALELAEHRWQLAIEGTNDSVWDWDINTGRIFHDERWDKMLGYERGELDETNQGWKALVHPDDLPANELAVREHFEQRTPFYQHEVRMRAKDGTWRWILDRGKVVRRAANGQPLRMAGTHTDITARKQLEERLRKSEELASEVSRLAQIGGWEHNLRDSHITWNEGTRRIHEVDETFLPTVESAWQFFPPESRVVVQNALGNITPAMPSFDVEVKMLTARGRRRWVRLLGHGEFRNGKATSVHGAIQDVTAQHEGEESRHQLETQLFQAQKMETLGTLAGGIAHDFNNLLTGIIGYHELAADSLPEDHPARMCLNEARNASLRARELVEQILTFGRQSASTEHGPVDLVMVLEEARRFLRATLPANVTIEAACAPNCGTVLADATQLHQVILNLGSNAAHAMRQQGGTLRISLEPAEITPDLALSLGGPTANSYVRLSVSDNGHGMDEATRRRIFDPFFTTKNTREGTGLGLAVVHGIVRSHRGAIDVDSTPGQGSTFHVYLPTAPAEKPTPDAMPSSSPCGEGEYVCVVDDEEVVGSCTKLVLESKGYRSRIYSSAEQCLAEIEADPTRCTVLVTDQTMPGMQGTELAARLRRINPTLPIVIMSGYFSKISPQALDQLGQVELLAKPFTTDELALAVHRALHPVMVE